MTFDATTVPTDDDVVKSTNADINVDDVHNDGCADTETLHTEQHVDPSLQL